MLTSNFVEIVNESIFDGHQFKQPLC